MLFSYFYRCVTVAFRSLRQPRLATLENCITRIKVNVFDLDAYLHVNNGRVLTIGDWARTGIFVRSGIGALSIKNGYIPLVAANSAHYYRELKLGDVMDIHTQVAGWDNKFVFLEHKYMVKDQEHCHVMIKAVWKKGRRTVRPIDILRDLVRYDNDPALTPFWQRQRPHPSPIFIGEPRMESLEGGGEILVMPDSSRVGIHASPRARAYMAAESKDYERLSQLPPNEGEEDTVEMVNA